MGEARAFIEPALWFVSIAAYLGVGAVIDHSIRWLNGPSYTVSRWISILVTPVAMLGAMPMIWLNLIQTRWWRRVSNQRVSRFLMKVRRRHAKLSRELDYRQQLLEMARKELSDERKQADLRAKGEALGILNDHWLDATGAARDAMAKCFEEKLRELYDQRAKERLSNYKLTGDVATIEGRIE